MKMAFCSECSTLVDSTWEMETKTRKRDTISIIESRMNSLEETLNIAFEKAFSMQIFKQNFR